MEAIRILKLFVILISVNVLIVGCKKEEIILEEKSVNTFSLDYSGHKLVFNDVSLYSQPGLDQDGDNGIRVHARSIVLNIEYVLIIYYKLDEEKYKMHSINLNVKEKLSEDYYHLANYYAPLSEGFNVKDFVHSINQKENILKGAFSGILTSIIGEEIKITNGQYLLDVKTVIK